MVHIDGPRSVATLRPGQRLYSASQSPFATVAVRYRPMHDLYVVLGGFDREGRWATLKAQIHPLIAWIWLGGAVVVFGGLVALLPLGRRLPVSVPAREAAAIAGASDATVGGSPKDEAP